MDTRANNNERLDWTLDLLSDTREVVLELLRAKNDLTPDLGALAERVVAYRDQVHAKARVMTDVELADTLTDATLDLLAQAARGPSDVQRLASVAARYFVHEADPDHESQLASPYGFDDDVEVFNAIAARIAPNLVLVP